MIPFSIPVEPEPPQAREWITNELAKAPYQAAQPTLFDRVAKAITDWFSSLQLGTGTGPPGLGLGVVVVLVVVAIVVAFLIFGVPRLNRRSAVAGVLFGEDDARNADRMRADAAAAASRGEYDLAIEELFRAIARGLAQRTIVTTTPGTTAHGFARRAAAAFPSSAEALVASAAAFDDVRYLSRPGTRQAYESIAMLDAELRNSRPRTEPVPA